MNSKSNSAARRRLFLEPLESRLCLSFDVGFSQGVLTIEGSQEADSILIRESGRGVTSVVDGNSGQRWQFRGVSQIVVRTGDGDDFLRVAEGSGDVKNLDASTGGGNDSVWIDLGSPVAQKVREAVAVKVDLGEGDDSLNASTRGIDEVDLDLVAGGGDDNVLIGLLVPAVQKVREAAARARVDLGEGNDRLQSNTTGIEDVEFDIAAGGGDDSVLIGMLVPAVQKVREAAARAKVDLGEGNNELNANAVGLDDVQLDITSGGGDDSVLIGMLLPAVQKVRESAARVNANLGEGQDRLQSTTVGFHEVDLNINSGGGDDSVLIGMLLPAIQKVRESAARMNIDLGEGNKRLAIGSIGMQKVDLDITAGGGDDNVLIGLLLPAVQKVRGSVARVKVDLGRGANELVLRTHGYETVETPGPDDSGGPIGQD